MTLGDIDSGGAPRRNGLSNDPDALARKTLAFSLSRIAKALDLPVAALYGTPEIRSPAAQASPNPGSGELLDLVQAYLRVHEPTARARCLAFVRAAAVEPDA